MKLPGEVFKNVTNTITVEVENNATMDYAGVYIFAGSSKNAPTKLTSAKDNDTETVIATGEKKKIKLDIRPTVGTTNYLFVTDKNLNVLAQTTFVPTVSTPELTVNKLAMLSSPDKDKFMDKDYDIIYNNMTTAQAQFTNTADCGYEKAMPVMKVYEYNSESSEWDYAGYASGTLNIAPKAQATVDFSLYNSTYLKLQTGKYYYGVLSDNITTTSPAVPVSFAEGTDSIVRFTMRNGDMEVVSFENNVLTLKGHFDQTAFAGKAFAQNEKYATAKVYDLTQCVGVNNVHQTVNPNALYYTSNATEGTNAVVDDHCSSLKITTGIDFVPQADFTADGVVIDCGEMNVGKWYWLTTPFAVTATDGIVLRELQGHSTIGMSDKLKYVTVTEPGKTYMVMTSSTSNHLLSGVASAVKAAPVTNADTCVIGTYVNAVVLPGAMEFNNDSPQKLVQSEDGATVEALRGYLCDPKVTRKLSTYNNTALDPQYISLALAINEAYSVIEEYESVVSKNDVEALIQVIADAEHSFTCRTGDETALEIKALATNVTEAARNLKEKVLPGVEFDVDCTSAIQNPSFESNSVSGWTLGSKEGVTSVGSVVKASTMNEAFTVGGDGSYIFRSKMSDNTSVSISQNVTGLMPGTYRLTAMVGTDAGMKVTLFAGDKTAETEAHELGVCYLRKATIDNIEVKADEGSETGSIQIGIQAGDMYKVDDFKLVRTMLEPSATGIEEIASDKIHYARKDGIYNLSGMRLSSMPQHGFFIKSGKKYAY